MTQEKSPMESRNLCGKNVAKFRNLLAGSPSQEKRKKAKPIKCSG